MTTNRATRQRRLHRGFLIGAAVAALVATAACSPAKTGTSGTASGVSTSKASSGTLDIGVLASVTGPLPGLSENAQKAVKAYAAMVNANGGTAGRKWNVITADDGLDPVKAKSACADLIPKVFAIVGSVGFGDAGCYPQVKSSGIPWIGYAYDNAQYYELPNAQAGTFAPAGVLSSGPIEELLKLHPEVKKAAIPYVNIAGNLQNVNAWTKILKNLGVDVLPVPIPANTVDFTSYVLKMKDAGVQMVDIDAADTTVAARFAKAMQQQNFDPPVKEAILSYSSGWQTLAGSAGKGWYSWLTTVPYLSQSEMNATQGGKQFLEWYNKTNPGATVDLWSIYGWLNAEFFAQGVEKAGSDLTGATLIDALKTLKQFDAKGLIGPTDATAKKGSNCFNLVQADGTGSFNRIFPAQAGTFSCDLGQLVSAGA